MKKSPSEFLVVEPGKASVGEILKLLSGGVAPRPIALVSTISDDGINNLAPFSYFNTFGAKPPIIGFSVVRRIRNNKSKDTLNNLKQNRECVVHAVSHNMLQQTNLASTEYAPEIDEFKKADLRLLQPISCIRDACWNHPFRWNAKCMKSWHWAQVAVREISFSVKY